MVGFSLRAAVLLVLIALPKSVRVAREAMLVATVRLGTHMVAAARISRAPVSRALVSRALVSRTLVSRALVSVIAVGAMLERQAWWPSLAAGLTVMVRAPTPRGGLAWRRAWCWRRC
jgi:predicted anti-sigma-YlaC factor YlaD